jgi:hypothetical protein
VRSFDGFLGKVDVPLDVFGEFADGFDEELVEVGEGLE